MKVEELKGFGMPDEAVEILLEEGIKELFQPQEIAVNEGLLELSGNFLVSVPTAAGKTLLAELLMVRSILERKRSGRGGAKCLYVVPLKALATEKSRVFRRWERLGIRTGISTGDMDSTDPWLAGYDIIVATSEKVDSLIRHRAEWLGDVSVLVVDEIHLIHDARRGPTLEVTVARMRHLNPDLIILGLSATVQNAGEIAQWLDAKLVESTWRPVELREGVYLKGSIFFTDSTLRDVQAPLNTGDGAPALALETVAEGGQALVFLNTRRSVESFADSLDATPWLSKREMKRLKEVSHKVLHTLSEPTKTCVRLSRCIRKGVAFHHAGLLMEQRHLVEDAFRENTLKVVSATPTLAAGVNLPARRVIIKDYHRYDVNIGRVQIPVLEYKQMAGRAGRPGFDTSGEAILISRTEDERDHILENYLLAEPEEIWSKLAVEASLRTHVLSTIAGGMASSSYGLVEFFSKTLFGFQQDVDVLHDLVERVVDFLVREGMVERMDGGGRMRATPFGMRVSQLYIDPVSAVAMRDALSEARGRPTREISYLHAISATGELGGLYLRRRDFETFSQVYYENQPFLLARSSEGSLSTWDFESLLAEVKMASFLLDWINESGEEEIREKYGLAPGDIRGRVEIAGWMLYCMRELGRLFKYPKQTEIRRLESRVKYGVKEELLELVSLKGIGRARARALYRRGFRTVADLKRADIADIAKVELIGKKTAENIKKQLI
ncbi:MAG: DEAD/DEAH box helicase [Methanobacteriota archaeon]|nr:MAG: DEAD/DEAH box helicase [Euryarchaeota archaeon]